MSTAPETIKDIIDPRQLKCLALWRNPKSDTFGNLRGSAILAGYSEQYADNITQFKPAWLSVSAKKDVERVVKAESNMDEDLNIEVIVNGRYDIDKARLRFEVSKFVLKTLAKQKYSEDSELTPPNVQINIINYDKVKSAPNGHTEVKEAEIVTPSGDIKTESPAS